MIVRLPTLACLLVAGAALAQSGGLYQWKDARGVTHYSDAPPPSGQYQARRIVQREAPPAAAAPAAPAAPAADKSAATARANANCSLARSNLEKLQAGGAIGLDADGDGKPDAPLSEEARSQQLRLAEANIQAFCAPQAARATP